MYTQLRLGVACAANSLALVSSHCSGRLAPGVLLAVVILAACTAPCSAGFMNYGNLPGATVNYLDVTESSPTDVPLLFGTPSVFGDSLDFTPLLFHATSLLGAVRDTTDGRLVFTMEAKPNNGISNLMFSEGGAFIVAGSGTDATYTSVTAAGNLDIYEVDGSGVNIIKVPIKLVFSHRADGLWELVTDSAANGLPWTGSQFIDLNAELTSRNISFTRGVTRLAVDLDNILVAQSEANSSAMIDKKDFGFHVRVNVPEPTTACLGLVALFGSVLLARRGRR